MMNVPLFIFRVKTLFYKPIHFVSVKYTAYLNECRAECFKDEQIYARRNVLEFFVQINAPLIPS